MLDQLKCCILHHAAASRLTICHRPPTKTSALPRHQARLSSVAPAQSPRQPPSGRCERLLRRRIDQTSMAGPSPGSAGLARGAFRSSRNLNHYMLGCVRSFACTSSYRLCVGRFLATERKGDGDAPSERSVSESDNRRCGAANGFTARNARCAACAATGCSTTPSASPTSRW